MACSSHNFPFSPHNSTIRLGVSLEMICPNIINGEPWLPNEQPFYEAVDALWSNWDEQSPANEDLAGQGREAFFNGSNFLGTYSTGMLRVGFLFN